MTGTVRYIFTAGCALLLSAGLHNAFAEEPTLEYTNDPNAIVLTKKVENDPVDQNKYWIELGAFVTGTEVVNKQQVPADFILIFDLSGSMYYTSGSTYFPSGAKSLSYNHYRMEVTSLGGTNYYYKIGNSYYKINRGSDTNVETGDKYYLYFTKDKTTYYLKGDGYQAGKYSVSDPDEVIYTGDNLYTKTRIDAMRDAAKRFINQVHLYSKNAGFAEGSGHRISLVKFANTKKTEIGNDGYNNATYPDPPGFNYSQILTEVTDVTSDSSTESLFEVIDALWPGGSTNTHYGLQLAKDIIDGSHDDRPKVVLLYTDGNASNASIAYTAAADLKKIENVSLYTIGLENSSLTNEDFLDQISSNFPGQTSATVIGDRASDSYFKHASNDNVGDVFEGIAKSFFASAVGYNLTSSAMAVDVVSQNFTLPEGADPSMIEVYTAPYTGYAHGQHTFDTASKTALPGASVTVDGAKVSVSGFNYSHYDNYCRTRYTYHLDGSLDSIENVGNELLIRFPIYPSSTNPGGGDLNTNTTNSGIYVGSDSTPLRQFDVPKVNLPNMTITKNGLNSGDRAIFRVSKLNEDDTIDTSFPPINVSILSKGGSSSARIMRLRPGKYIVEELTDWSWSYTATTVSQVTTVANANVNLTFSNTKRSKSTIPSHAETSRNNVFK